MPQPFSKHKTPRGAGFSHALLKTYPELSAIALEAIVSWTDVEVQMLRVYLALLNSPDDFHAATGYLAIEGRSAKTRMVDAVAKEKLSDEKYKLFTVILRDAKSSQTQRDKLAHWSWGVSEDIPDAFVLSNPKYMWTHLKRNSEVTYVYRRKDFDGIIKKNQWLVRVLSGLQFVVQDDHPFNEGDNTFRSLCQEPDIRVMLDKIN